MPDFSAIRIRPPQTAMPPARYIENSIALFPSLRIALESSLTFPERNHTIMEIVTIVINRQFNIFYLLFSKNIVQKNTINSIDFYWNWLYNIITESRKRKKLQIIFGFMSKRLLEIL